VGAALVWQIAFIFIATDPVRYRPLMIPSVLEKVSYGAAVVTLVLQGRMHRSDLVFAGTDLLLGLLFVIAYFKTPTPAVVAR
jgi:hypothetical protein